MATIRLGRSECENGHLPLVCMRCGAAAKEVVRQRFTWRPPWIIWAFFFCVVPYVVLALALNRSMRVQAPLCSEHRRHWANRKLFNRLTAVVLTSYVIFFTLLTSTDPLPRQLRDQVADIFCLSFPLALLVGAIAATAWDFSSIRAQRIDDHSITLEGVAPGFVAAVQAQA
jgi:hypothetical protein